MERQRTIKLKRSAQYADRLAIERRIAEDLKETTKPLLGAENARRIAGDAMDEDVAMEQSLEKRARLFDYGLLDGVRSFTRPIYRV